MQLKIFSDIARRIYANIEIESGYKAPGGGFIFSASINDRALLEGGEEATEIRCDRFGLLLAEGGDVDAFVEAVRLNLRKARDKGLRALVNAGRILAAPVDYIDINERLRVAPDGAIEIDGSASSDVSAWRVAAGAAPVLLAHEAAKVILKPNGEPITTQHLLRLCALNKIECIHYVPTGAGAEKGLYGIPLDAAQAFKAPGSGRAPKSGAIGEEG